MTEQHSTPEPDPSHAADELFVHGVLSHLVRDDSGRKDERLRRALAAVRAEGESPIRFRIVAIRRYAAIAAVLVIVALAFRLGLPLESSAEAIVQSSIQAMKSGGERRYEVRELRGNETRLGDARMTIDMRDGMVLLRGRALQGHKLVVGRDRAGDWAIRPDGGIERDHPERAWPKWASVGDESLFANSVDRLLEEIAKGFRLEREKSVTLEGRGDKRFELIRCTRVPGPMRGPASIDLWLDDSTRVVERIEMKWIVPPGPRGPDSPRPPGEGGPRDFRPPPGERPVPPEFRPEGGGPLGPGGPRPGPDGGGRPLPPRLVVIDRVDAEPLGDEWFSPEKHK